MPPPGPEPMPAPEPVPFDAIADLANGSPSTSMLTFGRLASGWITKVGSITSFGLTALLIIGGTNCRGDSFGSLPLLTGIGERSPPPPPPPIRFFFGGVGL